MELVGAFSDRELAQSLAKQFGGRLVMDPRPDTSHLPFAALVSLDSDAADELLSSWKERESIVKDTASQETKARKESIKRASTGNTKGSSEAPSRKIYRRADIIKLMQTDPDRYMALAQEIRQAYAENRVR